MGPKILPPSHDRLWQRLFGDMGIGPSVRTHNSHKFRRFAVFWTFVTWYSDASWHWCSTTEPIEFLDLSNGISFPLTLVEVVEKAAQVIPRSFRPHLTILFWVAPFASFPSVYDQGRGQSSLEGRTNEWCWPLPYAPRDGGPWQGKVWQNDWWQLNIGQFGNDWKTRGGFLVITYSTWKASYEKLHEVVVAHRRFEVKPQGWIDGSPFCTLRKYPIDSMMVL